MKIRRGPLIPGEGNIDGEAVVWGLIYTYTPTHTTTVFTKEIRAVLLGTSARQSRVSKQWQECALMYGQYTLHYDLPGNDPLIPQITCPSCSRIHMKGNKTDLEMVFQEILPLFNCSFKDFCHFPAADQKKKKSFYTAVQISTLMSRFKP